MATVYLARDEKHGRMVAIKVLRPELGASIGIDRFLREIRTAAQLQHPNILALYDSGEADGLLFYVMPFVEGESLRDRLTREKQLPIEDAVMLVHEAADALHFAHQHGVVHRDIKPENILIQGGHALVADFGIARAFSEASGEKLTQTGMAIGTPHYMSPEQGMGGDVDGRSDVYSLGCVLYELLVGQPPFDGPNAMAILARHSMEAVPAMHVVRRTIPEDLEAVVEESLEKSAADRFQTAEAFSEALLSVDLSHVTRRHAVPRVTMSRVMARKKQRRKTVLLAAGIGTLVLGGAAAAFVATRGPGGAKPAAAGLDPGAIAVLYFEGRGGDSLKYVADGLTEALIKELSGVNGLTVISRNGVRPYRGGNVAPDSIGRALQVGTVVEGTLSQSGDSLLLDVGLTSTESRNQVGSKTLKRARGEIFALQEDLAREISDFLRGSLRKEVELRQSRQGTRNTKAWELAQRAEVSNKDGETLVASGDAEAARRQFAQADSLLGLAAREDRKWIAPLTQRAFLTYWDCRRAQSDKVYNDTCTQKGLGFAEAAIALDSADADAREARGSLKYWRWLLGLEPDPSRAAKLLDEAEADLRASVAANEQQASAWSTLSHLHFNRAQAADGKLAALKAYQSDPYLTSANVVLSRLFSAAHDAGDQIEATKWCAEGQRRFPEDARFVECRLKLFVLPDAKPDIPAGWKLVDRYLELSPPGTREYRQKRGGMLMAMALARARLADSAKRVAERSRAEASLDPTLELVYWESLMLAMIPDKDNAFDRFKVYLAANPQQAKNLEKDQTWWTRELRSDSRWRDLIVATR